MAPAISISNRLLVALAREDLDPLRPHLEPVPLSLKQILSNPNMPIDHVYFPQDGMVSLVQPLENGAMIEVGMIGKEGLVGVPVLLCADTSPLEAMVQIPGLALRMEASVFRKEPGRAALLDCCFGMFRHFTFRSRCYCRVRYTQSRWLDLQQSWPGYY